MFYVHHFEDKQKHLSDQAACIKTFPLEYSFCQKVIKDVGRHTYSSKQLMCGHIQLTETKTRRDKEI